MAEYQALIHALKEAAALEAKRLKIFTDSELLFSQVTGRYKVKNEQLKMFFEEAQKLAAKFQEVKIDHIPREKNQEADRLATQALKKQAKMVTSASIAFKAMKWWKSFVSRRGGKSELHRIMYPGNAGQSGVMPEEDLRHKSWRTRHVVWRESPSDDVPTVCREVKRGNLYMEQGQIREDRKNELIRLVMIPG